MSIATKTTNDKPPCTHGVSTGELTLKRLWRNRDNAQVVVSAQIDGYAVRQFEIDAANLKSFARFQAEAFRVIGVWFACHEVLESQRHERARRWRWLVEGAFQRGCEGDE